MSSTDGPKIVGVKEYSSREMMLTEAWFREKLPMKDDERIVGLKVVQLHGLPTIHLHLSTAEGATTQPPPEGGYRPRGNSI